MAKAERIPAAVPNAPLSANAALPVLVRLDELLRFAEGIHDPGNVAGLHAMRIAAKRLRYTLEIFAGAIGGSDGFLRTLKGLQDLLGEIHDADVLAPLLGRDIERGGENAGLSALLNRTVSDRSELYARLLTTWDAALSDGFPEALRAAAFSATLPEIPAADITRGASITLCLLRLAGYAADGADEDALNGLERLVGKVEKSAGDEAALRKACRNIAQWIRKEAR